VITILQRICWNGRGWQIPSGSAGHESGFPSANGYAHEEWNFQTDDAYKGYVYGYIYTPPKIIKEAEKFRIVFFGIHPKTKERLIVGIYHAAELGPKKSYEHLFAHFQKEGIFTRRADELCEVVPGLSHPKALKEVKNSVNKKWLSIRCPASKIQVFQQPIPLTTIAGKQKVGEYFRRFTHLRSEFSLPKFIAKTTIPTKGQDKKGPLAEDAYYRESPGKIRHILRLHSVLSNQFTAWLKETYGIKAHQEQDRVDVRFDLGKKSVLAEIKICYGVGTTKSIREALGQLLEYNHYPPRSKAALWMIILNKEPSDMDRKFIGILRDSISLPLTVGWQIEGGFSFYPKNILSKIS